MTVDISGTAVNPLTAIQSNINSHFAQLLDGAVDYQIIFLSDFGKIGDKAICIPAPLGGLPCDPLPSKPANGARFFHYDVKTDGLNSLALLLSTYGSPDVNAYFPGGWKDRLRRDALGRESLKAFINITGTDPSIVGAEFEAALLAKTPAGTFGDTVHPNHIFHNVIGVAANTPATEPWQSTDLLISVACSAAVRAGLEYQRLSTSTGGLRFSICEIASYGAALEALARDIDAAARVQCDFTPPPPDASQRYGRAYIEYTPTVGPVEHFLPAADLASCSATGFLRDSATDAIALCPQACAKVRADATAQISVRYACVSSAGL